MTKFKWQFFGVTATIMAFGFYALSNKGSENVNTGTPSQGNEIKRSIAAEPSSSATSLSYPKEKYNFNGKNLSLDDHLLDIKTASDISGLAKQIILWDKKYNLTPSQSGQREVQRELLRIYAIIAEYVPLSKGLVYRFREIVGKDMGIHAASLTALREMKYNASETPQHLNALFDFLTSPNPSEVIEGQKGLFKNTREALNFAVLKVAPKLERSIEELGSLIESGRAERPVFITNLALALGKSRASRVKNDPANSSVALEKIVLANHLYGVKALAQTFLGSLYYMASYNIEGHSAVANKIFAQMFNKKLFSGISDRFSTDLVEFNNLPSPKEFKKFVNVTRRKRKYRNFLMLRDVNYLARSKKFYMEATESDYVYHKALIDLASWPSQNSYIVNAAFFEKHSHGPLEVINIRRTLFKSKRSIEIKNFTTSEKMKIDIHKFFDPDVMKDLASFMPTQFNKAGEFSGRGEKKVWNYMYGRSEQWPDPKFGNLIPEGNQRSTRKNLMTIYQHPSLAFLAPLMALYR